MSSNDRHNHKAKNQADRHNDPAPQSDNIVRPLNYKMVADCLLSLKEQISQEPNPGVDLEDLSCLLDTAVKEFSQASFAQFLPPDIDYDLPAASTPGPAQPCSSAHEHQDPEPPPAPDNSPEPSETLEQAIKRCQNTVNLDPLNYGANFELGIYLRVAGRYREAMDAFMSFLPFVNVEDPHDLDRTQKALKWLRYLDRKIELFGNCRQ